MSSTFNPNQPRGHHSNPGRWAAYQHSEPESGVMLAPPVETRGEIDLELVGSRAAAEEIAAGITNGTDTYSLMFVDYNDQLRDEQIADLLAGRLDQVEESVLESFDDYRYESALSEAKTACEARGVDFDELDPDDQDTIRHAIEERDDSNPVSDLLRNTPPQLLRAPLLGSVGAKLIQEDRQDLIWYDNQNWEEQEQKRTKFLLDELERAGMDIRGNAELRQAVAGLVTEGPSNWHEEVTFDVIWYGEVEDAIVAPVNYPDAPDAIGRQLAFQDANVVLLDTANGSGMDAPLRGNVTVNLSHDRPAYLDSQASGYGWDDTAGVHKPAYKAGDVTSTWVQAGK